MEKNIHNFFSTFGSKINEFKQKESGKNEKIPETQKLQAIYPNWSKELCQFTT